VKSLSGYQFLRWQINSLTLTLLLLSSALFSFAQKPLFTNQAQFSVEDGLPQSYVSGITQDADGFIWIATLDGFCRYDGRVFKTFRSRANDHNSIAANTVYNLGIQVNNVISLYYSPLQVDNFNLRTFKVTRNHIRTKLKQVPDAIWEAYHAYGTSPNWLFIVKNNRGIGWMNARSGTVSYANRGNGKLHSDTICGMIESPGGKVFIINEQGVNVTDTSLHKFHFIPFQTNIRKSFSEKGIIHEEFHSMAYLSGDRICMPEKGKIVILDINRKTSTVIPVPGAEDERPTNLQVDPKGRLYFTTFDKIFRIENNEPKLLWQNNINPNLRITTHFIDRSDVLWASVNAQGLLKIDLQALPFKSFAYNKNFIFDVFESAGIPNKNLPPEWNHIESSYLLRQAYDTKGNLYICDWFSKNIVFHVSENRLKPLASLKGQQAGFTALFTTPDDQLWAYDQKEYSFYKWESANANPVRIPLNKDVMKEVEIADGKFAGGFIWLTTNTHGLLQYRSNQRINQFSGKQAKGFLPETLTEMCIDPFDKNILWIGTRGGGLVSWHVTKGLQNTYTTENGLPNNTVYCIVPDDKGNLWCSTNKGVFRFDAKRMQVTSFQKTDGLPGNEFNRAHKFRFDDGRICFGGLDGYSIFSPSDFDIRTETVPVPVQITGVTVNNQPLEAGVNGSSLKTSLSETEFIELPYDKNDLRFEFAAMLFNQSHKTRYRYQLEGADDEWIENGTNNLASYTALRPGNYTFRVNATDKNGLWSNTVKELGIHILPPFWATWWAYLVYILIAGGLLRLYLVFRERQLKMEQKLAFEKREALRLREIDELKDRFFSNITHEFRTPLTLIMSPLDNLLKDDTVPLSAHSHVKTAKKNSEHLLKLINEFLDFSKLNDGQMRVKLAAGEFNIFIRDSVKGFEPAATEKGISLGFTSSLSDSHYLFDKEKWEKILNNLLSNAIKFTPAAGKVDVSISDTPVNHIRLVVSDTGPGIPQSQQQKVFDRFYQAETPISHNYGGTGIGLSLVKELAEIMNGKVWLESEPAILTKFIVEVPVQKMKETEASVLIKRDPSIQEREQDPNAPMLLVAEDNDELRAFLVESMRSKYRVIEASDGLMAWELILQELPDIVLSDVMMPGQDGFDLCHQCKTDNRTAHIGFILLTSKSAHEARIRGLENAADDYITKPFILEELMFRTSNLINMQANVRTHLRSQLVPDEIPRQLPPVTDPFLVELYGFIDDKLDDPQLGVDYLCRQMSMSRSTLNRKLKAILDISPNDLVRQYRLQKATSLISAGKDISSAAYQVGFSSPSYFSQCFREKYGMTPSEHVSMQI